MKNTEKIKTPFPNGESLIDVEIRVREFCQYLLENYIFYSFDLIELNNNCQKDHSVFHIPHLLIADLNHNH